MPRVHGHHSRFLTIGRGQITFLGVLLAAIFVLLSACTGRKSESSTVEDRLARAYRMIDEGREDEAIQSLKFELQSAHDPEITEALTTGLASAYVSKAGLSAQRFYGFARAWMQEEGGSEEDFNFFQSPTPTATDEQKPLNAGSSAVEIFEDNGLQALAFFLVIKSRFEALPSISDEQETPLKEAIAVLASLKQPSRGAALYRGLLKTVRFKHHVHSGFFKGEARASSTKKNQECLIGKIQFIDSLTEAVAEAEDVITDLSLAFPNQASSFSEALDGARRGRRNLQELANKVEALGTNETFVLNEVLRLAKTTLGWSWACE